MSPYNFKYWLPVLFFGAVLIFFSGDARAQQLSMRRQSIGVAGQSATLHLGSKSYLVQSSTGQGSVIGSSSREGLELRQGFIQPFGQLNITPVSDLLELTIYPNPFQTDLWIAFDDEFPDRLDIQMSDLGGRMILSETRVGSETLRLSIPSIASGIYLLHLSSGDKHYTGKVQKY